ncbi:hypothetical protein VKT23_010469 [Stygiomarasmius scandens]|uniref:Uncharacterized protein n=1 Tax=Marasmiellus scandens TaxID=2682957 RepID=A0ABR1JCR3_9AGAR
MFAVPPDSIEKFVLGSTLPKNFSEIAQRASERHSSVKYHRALSSVNPMLVDSKKFTVVDKDIDGIEEHWLILNQAYDTLLKASSDGGCEAEMRRGLDILLALVFQDRSDLPDGCAYRVERKVSIPAFDRSQVNHFPSGTAVADAGCYQKFPPETQNILSQIGGQPKWSIGPGHELYASQYVPSLFEYKGDHLANLRQAILDSAAIQGVNRTLVSSWTESDTGYSYNIVRIPNVFNLSIGDQFLAFHSFLCRLRREHHGGFIHRKLIELGKASNTLERIKQHLGWISSLPMPSIVEEEDGNGFHGTGVSNAMEDDIEVGEDAFTKVPADQFVLYPDGPPQNEDGQRDTPPSYCREVVRTWQERCAAAAV